MNIAKQLSNAIFFAGSNSQGRFPSVRRNPGPVMVALAITASGLLAGGCSDPSDSDDEAILALAAMQLLGPQSSVDLCAMEASNTPDASCENGVATAGSNAYHLSTTNPNHPLLSLEVTFQLEEGGSLDVIGGIEKPGSDKEITWGHGIHLTDSSTEGAHFKGTDGSTVHEQHIHEFNPGTEEATICLELHQKESPPHMLVNWTNGGCDGLNAEGDADANTGEEHSHSTTIEAMLENDQDVSGDSYNTWGLIITNGTVKSVRRFPTPSFPHG